MKKILSALLTLALAAGLTVPALAAEFSDVSGWAKPYIERASELGLVTGTGGGKYSPGGKVSYGQFATMLCGAAYKGEAQTVPGDPWWKAYCETASQHGLFTGTPMSNRANWEAQNGQPVTRQDMAMMMFNLLEDREVPLPDSGQQQEAMAKIADYTTMNGIYGVPVLCCYSMGLITGGSSGNFNPLGTMDRAQAATVLCALYDTLGGSAAPVETEKPEEPVTPAEPSGAVKDIEVTTNVTQYGTGYYVKDNGFGDGYLNNGKPITEENVLELLDEAQKIWPTGTSWGKRATRNNHWYEWSGSVVDSVVLNKYNVSTNYACGGFAAMISDYLFGLDNNTAHRVTDPMDIRAGDIIVQMNYGEPIHVMIAETGLIKSGDFQGRLYTANGNPIIAWADYEYGAPTSEALDKLFNPGRTWEIWSRYPA